jgi:chemotaxis protein histidine kinase CheA
MTISRQNEFLVEAEEIIEQIFAALSALRIHNRHGRERRELIARIFRGVHTLKSAAAVAEWRSIARLAHECETLLDHLRLGQIELNEITIGALQAATAHIADHLAARANKRPLKSSRRIIKELRDITAAHRTRADSIAEIASALPRDFASAVSEYERQRLRETVLEGAKILIIAVAFDISDFDARFRELSERLNAAGETIATLPGVSSKNQAQIGFQILYAAHQSLARIEELLDSIDAHIHVVHDNATQNDSRRAAQPSDEGESQRGFLRGGSETQFDGTQTVSLRRVFARALRAGRATARAAGKQVDFQIKGGATRINRQIAQRLAVPLLHLLRNAVAHGIESGDERQKAGKPARGKIRLEAFMREGASIIRISDDGRGIDAEEIRRLAQERGITLRGANANEDEILRLIFQLGFSTAAKITSVSGRGIGLHIVEREIEDLGGEVRVFTQKGVGTTFEIELRND